LPSAPRAVRAPLRRRIRMAVQAVAHRPPHGRLLRRRQGERVLRDGRVLARGRRARHRGPRDHGRPGVRRALHVVVGDGSAGSDSLTTTSALTRIMPIMTPYGWMPHRVWSSVTVAT